MTTRRDVLNAIPSVGTAFAVSGAVLLDDFAALAQEAAPLEGHFHPNGKAPSQYTLDVLDKARDALPFSDRLDFDEQQRGLIAEMPDKKIMADAGHVAWDKERFDFLNSDTDFDSIHPSLQRISRLNQNYGLYEVIPGIYQVRGFDLSDISFVRGKTGWIVIDPLVSAEPARAALHNIYTLRGAPVRDPLRWSKYTSRALHLYGEDAEVKFYSYHWPRWGNNRIQAILRDQRDLNAHMNNQVLHFVNTGVTINRIHNVYELPQSLQDKWHCRGYHGSLQHNSRGVVQRYIGFWDCNPATLIPLSPEDSAPLYVEMMGGSEAIMTKGRELHDSGEYLLASEILDKLVHAEPGNQAAKNLLADVYEQIGYQQENPGLRNSFLSGAFELRSGIPEGDIPDTSSPDVIRAMSTELFLNFLAIKMDSRKVEGHTFAMNLVTPDNGEKFLVELRNATLTNVEGFQSDTPDLTLTINRSDLELTMAGEKTLDEQLADGTATLDGDATMLGVLAQAMVDFDPFFEVLPGTRDPKDAEVSSAAFEAVTGLPAIE